MAIRRSLHPRGLRYRVHVRPVPSIRRTADVVFTRARIAVFVDGCFWHGCPDCYGARIHKTHPGYWTAKIQRNRARDEDTDHRLTEAGWHVVRIWEHEDPETAATRVFEAWRSQSGPASRSPGRRRDT
jgi:DNA mismatch endonuclease (patch repair protein)